jgi:hypothetical protein
MPQKTIDSKKENLDCSRTCNAVSNAKVLHTFMYDTVDSIPAELNQNGAINAAQSHFFI